MPVGLHFVAFDLARSADGQWWVLSDRTQAPSGAGYALENRIVVSPMDQYSAVDGVPTDADVQLVPVGIERDRPGISDWGAKDDYIFVFEDLRGRSCKYSCEF